MKRLMNYILIIITISVNATSSAEGNSGITFEMTQQQLEAKGFICKYEVNVDENSIWKRCRNKSMTGMAFGKPTKDYILTMGRDGKVNSILAEVVADFNNKGEVLIYTQKIQESFPIVINVDMENFVKNDVLMGTWKNKKGTEVWVTLHPMIRSLRLSGFIRLSSPNQPK